MFCESKWIVGWVIAAVFGFFPAQTSVPAEPITTNLEQRLKGIEDSIDFSSQVLTAKLAESAWFRRMQDIATVDKIRYVGPPPRSATQRKITTNSIPISAYTFLPRKQVRRGKIPLIVLLHTEVHGAFNPDDDFRITHELVEQGYAVIAPDYRGSTGYGGDFWRLIDYGGLEIEDAHLARKWMIEQHPGVDPHRVGIMGWSHGGAIALMAVFAHPDAYAVVYAGMPVTDLEFRLREKEAPYRELFSVPYHLGKTVDEDPEEYRRRSPVTYAQQLQVPLLLHGVSNDEDVSLAEVERLVSALQKGGKQFQYRVYTNAPAGHAFNKLDTVEGKESRVEIYRFLAKYLSPPRPPR